MSTVTAIGLDIAKSVFQVHGISATGEVLIRRQVRRGQVHEVILLSIAIGLVIRMIFEPLMAEFREEAQKRSERPTSRSVAAAIIVLWIAAIALTLWAFWPLRCR